LTAFDITVREVEAEAGESLHRSGRSSLNGRVPALPAELSEETNRRRFSKDRAPTTQVTLGLIGNAIKEWNKGT